MRGLRLFMMISDVLLMTFAVSAQTSSICSLTVSTAPGDSTTVQIGSAPGATTGIDTVLGEMEIPPLPPAGVFDVRLIDPDTIRAALGEGVWLDLRAGDSNAPDSTRHLLVCQCGRSSDLIITWILPPGTVAIIASPPDVLPQRITASDTGSARVTARPGRNLFSIVMLRNARTLTARVFLEGPFSRASARMRTTLRDTGILAEHFSGKAIPASAVDSITIALHDSVSPGPSHVCVSLPAWLLADGTVCPFLPPFEPPVVLRGIPFVPLYVDVHHRNHLPVQTTEPLGNFATALNCDLTARADAVAGGRSTLLAPGIYGLIAGDTDGDSRMRAEDLMLVRSAIGRTRRYAPQDADMNAGVGATDLALVRRAMAPWLGAP